MKKLDEIKQVIRSMSLSEKRYFKLYSSLYSKEKINIHEQLFEIIEQNVSASEGEIKNEFKTQGGKLSYYSYYNNYLYNLLLKSLVLYRKKHSKKSQLRETIEFSEVLINRSLEKQALKIIDKGIQKANLEQYSLIELAFLEQRDTAWQRINLRGLNSDDIQNAYQLKIHIMEKYKFTSELYLILQQLYLSLQIGGIDQRKTFLKNIEPKLLSLKNREIIRKEHFLKIEHLQLMVKVFIFCREFEKAYKNAQILYNNLLNKTNTEVENKLLLIGCMNMIAITAILTGHNNTFFTFTKLTEKYKVHEPRLVIAKFSGKLVTLVFYSMTGQQNLFQHALNNCIDILNNYKPLGSRPYQNYVIDYWSIYNCILLTEYEKGFELSAAFLSKNKEQKEYFQYAKLIQLICALELNYKDFFYNALPSVKKYFYKHEFFLDQRILISAINVIAKNKNIDKMLGRLLLDLEEKEQNHFNDIGKPYFTTWAWIYSKQKNINLAEATQIWYQKRFGSIEAS